jgi:hypothetical protein
MSSNIERNYHNRIKLPETGNLWYPRLRDKQLATFEENQSPPAVRRKIKFYAYNISLTRHESFMVWRWRR